MDNYIAMPRINNLSENGTKWLGETMPRFDFSQFVNSITKGENIFKPTNILNAVAEIFAKEVHDSIKLLSVIVAIVMISALLDNLSTSFNKQNRINSGIIMTALIAGLAGEIFAEASMYAMTISDDLTKIMWALLPVMTTLLAGSGFTTTGIMTHPLLYFMCNVFAEIFNKVLIPLAVTYLAISLADMISDTVKLEKFRELIKKLYNFLLGIVMTFFTGLLSISSFAGVSLDSVGARGAKFALSSIVPFVGRSLSDAMSAVASASLLLKNAVGITGIVCMLALCIIPVIKVAVIIISVRISTAVCEPVADRKTLEILSSVADSLSMINAAVISTVMMMIISVSIIVGIK